MMGKLHVVTMLWDWNSSLLQSSRCYDESWADKLCRGFKRNLTVPFNFVVFTDRDRRFEEDVVQIRMTSSGTGYGRFTEPYRLNEPMILVGLDTIVVDNIDHLAEYCLHPGKIALPRDPYVPERSINGVALVPPGHANVYARWRGENDMEWLRAFDVNLIDDLFPREVVSLKAHDVRRRGLQQAKIVYFHGRPKPHELGQLTWVRQHWR